MSEDETEELEYVEHWDCHGNPYWNGVTRCAGNAPGTGKLHRARIEDGRVVEVECGTVAEWVPFTEDSAPQTERRTCSRCSNLWKVPGVERDGFHRVRLTEDYAPSKWSPKPAMDGGQAQSTDVAGTETDQHSKAAEARTHVYAAINDGDTDNLAHEHLRQAYDILCDLVEEGATAEGGPASENVISGSFRDDELYPDRDELRQRVREEARDRFAPLPMDAEFNDVEIQYIGLEHGVVLYRIAHPKLGVFDPQ